MEPSFSTEQWIYLLVGALAVYMGYRVGNQFEGETGKLMGAAAGGVVGYYVYHNHLFDSFMPRPSTLHYH